MAKPRGRAMWAVGVVLALAAGITLWLLLKPPAALLPNSPGTALVQAAQGLDEVAVDAVLNPLRGTVEVSQSLTLTNRTGETQRLLVLRTYPNALASEDTSPAATDELYDACYPDGFSAGSLTVSQMRLTLAGGAEQNPAYAYGDTAQTVLRVSLPGDWQPGQTLSLQMRYTLQVPTARWRFGQYGGVWALGNAFAIPSPFLEGAYRTDDLVSIGEPYITECRNYTVRVTAPDTYALAGSGSPTVESDANGLRVTRFDAPAVRDFALYANASAKTAQGMQDGVLIRACANSAGDARTLVSSASKALACYQARYGAYPYPTLNLCAVDLPTGGTAFPGMVWTTPAELAREGDAVEQQIALLVARQWWAAVVGVDGFYQAWQADALSMFSLLDYWETQHGREARDELQFALTDTAMRLTIPRGVTPGSPLDYFGDWTEFRLVVTNRGAAALCALNTAMNGTLDEFLHTYYDTYAFALATREDFETLLARVTGQDWAPLLSDYLDTYIDN